MGDMIKIEALGEDALFPAYMAVPANGAKAAIIVIPEIFGVNAGIRQKCDRLAADGYLAVAPDIFWRFAPGAELNPDVEAELQQAFGYFGQYDADDGVKDIEAVIHAIRRGLSGQAPVAKVGCVGYCLGGRLAYMAAARTDISASVGYYGVMIDQMLNESHAIANPLTLHIPTADHFVGAQAQAAIHAGLDDHPKVTLHDYEGLDHRFATEMGDRRDDAGAELADERTAAFFAEHLA
jgi:carboxymethylenebutenolidase